MVCLAWQSLHSVTVHNHNFCPNFQASTLRKPGPLLNHIPSNICTSEQYLNIYFLHFIPRPPIILNSHPCHFCGFEKSSPPKRVVGLKDRIMQSSPYKEPHTLPYASSPSFLSQARVCWWRARVLLIRFTASLKQVRFRCPFMWQWCQCARKDTSTVFFL